ncbi:MAG TPA: hypothetical protein VFT75_18550 [Nocardioidaceae bacterium]|nr:hypothetical protein [Nocardioidaceae bacterium]
MNDQQLTDQQYDIADRIGAFLEGRGDQDFNASQLARAAKCSTLDVKPVLRWMVASHSIGVAGRGGCWIRYREHRHGEVNR